jgi:hypothetical protein
MMPTTRLLAEPTPIGWFAHRQGCKDQPRPGRSIHSGRLKQPEPRFTGCGDRRGHGAWILRQAGDQFLRRFRARLLIAARDRRRAGGHIREIKLRLASRRGWRVGHLAARGDEGVRSARIEHRAYKREQASTHDHDEHFSNSLHDASPLLKLNVRCSWGPPPLVRRQITTNARGRIGRFGRQRNNRVTRAAENDSGLQIEFDRRGIAREFIHAVRCTDDISHF